MPLPTTSSLAMPAAQAPAVVGGPHRGLSAQATSKTSLELNALSGPPTEKPGRGKCATVIMAVALAPAAATSTASMPRIRLEGKSAILRGPSPSKSSHRDQFFRLYQSRSFRNDNTRFLSIIGVELLNMSKGRKQFSKRACGREPKSVFISYLRSVSRRV